MLQTEDASRYSNMSFQSRVELVEDVLSIEILIKDEDGNLNSNIMEYSVNQFKDFDIDKFNDQIESYYDEIKE